MKEKKVLRTKEQFIGALQHFAECCGKGIEDEYGHEDYWPARGECLMAEAFANYLIDHNEIINDEHSNWFAHLNCYLVDAYVEFRTHHKYEKLRKQYASEMEREIPDLLVGGMYQSLTVNSLCRLMPILSGQTWLKSDLESYFGAQGNVIDHAWRAFVRKAYVPLMARIKKESHRGNLGKFGNTELMSWAGMGRVMFTFDDGNDSVSFVADDSDPIGHRSGGNFPSCSYLKAVALINDVTEHWDESKFIENNKVNIGF